jgi:hypothetical protein
MQPVAVPTELLRCYLTCLTMAMIYFTKINAKFKFYIHIYLFSYKYFASEMRIGNRVGIRKSPLFFFKDFNTK